jgi:hypoxia up-regulated 1
LHRIRNFDRSDKDRRQLEEDYNNLEAYIYKVRDILSDTSFTTFASTPMIKDIESLLKTSSKWLSDSEGTATSKDLKAKLKGLEEQVNPIKSRKEEAARRPELVGFLRDALQQAKGLAEVIRQSLESAKSAVESSIESSTVSSESSTTSAPAEPSSRDPLADLEEADDPSTTTTSAEPKSSEDPFVMPYTETDLEDMMESYESVTTWLDEKLVEQANLKEWEEPVLLSTDLQRKAKDLNDALMKLLQQKMRKPTSKGRAKKPKPTKKASKKDDKKPEEKKDEKNSDKKAEKIRDEL